MPTDKKLELLHILYKNWSGEKVNNSLVFPSAGSNRKYFRISSASNCAIGAIGEDPKENKAFLEFSRFFRSKGLHVPDIFAQDDEHGIYIQEDLGNQSLFDLIAREDPKNISENTTLLYKQSLEQLIQFQLEGYQGLDFSLCYPVSEFTPQSMLWDLNYFKYYFLRPSGFSYDEQLLENDFETLVKHLSSIDNNYFIYRDFQSRNIFIKDNKPWFIDYQGGRKGPAQYDVASLLFQAKANLSPEFREQMLDHYLNSLEKHQAIDRKKFIEDYYCIVLHRTLQVLGAYGYRGYFERKAHFIESARYALKNLQWMLNNLELPIKLPELYRGLNEIVAGAEAKEKARGLTVSVSSFSFLKYGYPKDDSGHGGGFVFDCRSLPNPGRHEDYKQLTGRDQPVIDFLIKEHEVDNYLENVHRLVGQAVDNYLVRGFDHLSIAFGCTGGQHRSVFCAENLYKYLRDNYRIKVNLSHKMLDLQVK